MQKFEGAFAEGMPVLAQVHGPLHPPDQRMRIARLRVDVERFVMIFRLQDEWQIERVRDGPRKPGVFVRTPLHRRADTIAVTEENIFAHADFIAVVKNWSARKGE